MWSFVRAVSVVASLVALVLAATHAGTIDGVVPTHSTFGHVDRWGPPASLWTFPLIAAGVLVVGLVRHRLLVARGHTSRRHELEDQLLTLVALWLALLAVATTQEKASIARLPAEGARETLVSDLIIMPAMLATVAIYGWRIIRAGKRGDIGA